MNIQKIDYCTLDTLKRLKFAGTYCFTIWDDIIFYKNDFKKWDQIKIINIDIANPEEKRTHWVDFLVIDWEWKKREMSMSWIIFLETFIKYISSENVVLNQTQETKNNFCSVLS